MKKQFIWPLTVISLLLCFIFCGCQKEQKSSTDQSPLTISVSEQIAYAHVGEPYDLFNIIQEEDGVTYDYIATYIDPTTGEKQTLNIRKGKITPHTEADIEINVTAMQGEKVTNISLIIPLKISADIIDELLAAQISNGVNKSLTNEAKYLQNENSSSAVAMTFSGSATLIDLSDHVLHPYYTAQVWKNAAVSFWVYNPMTQDITFKLGSFNPETEQLLTWDSPENTQTQTATAGQWTHIMFSLYDMGITSPLLDAATYDKEDSLHILTQYSGTEECTLYIDQTDIIHAEDINLTTKYSEPPTPNGNYTQLLTTCKVYTLDSVAKLEKLAQDTYRFGSNQQVGYPTFYVDFPKETDISGFEYLKFDVLGENCYPYLSVSLRYLDENGNIQQKGTYYDYYRNEWQSIYLNLDYLQGADLTKAVGFSFSVHMDKNFVIGQYNSVSFKNISLYDFPFNEPKMQPASIEDNDLISGTFYTTGTKPNVNGVCKVATDEAGNSRSNSALMFWTNNACGYPNVDANFNFDTPQDWSNKTILSFDTHQAGGHYWLQFDIIYIDENGNQKAAIWRYDTISPNWQTNHASLDWFTSTDGEPIKPSNLNQVVGFRIQANMAINVTTEVAQIFFDNFMLS